MKTIDKIVVVGGVVIVSEIVWYCYKKYRLWTSSSKPSSTYNANVDGPKENIQEVMFFTKECKDCRVHIVSDFTCLRDNCAVRNLRKLDSYIQQAERQLDICMYMLTIQSLATAMLNAHKRGVNVRIILDGRAAENQSSELTLFHTNGMAVKLVNIDNLMHHKFVIIDNYILITGSMNWTMAAIFGNYDNVMVTNQNWMVNPFVDEFNRLWQAFSKSFEDLAPKTDNGI